jgi:AcrR family transcriptional regulator
LSTPVKPPIESPPEGASAAREGASGASEGASAAREGASAAPDAAREASGAPSAHLAAAHAACRPLRADARRNRQRIIEAAAKQIAARGLDVQMEDIARAAGVGVGTIYRNFPTKQALVDALWEEKRSRVIAVAQRAAANPQPWEAVQQLFREGTDLQIEDLGWCEALGAQQPGGMTSRDAPPELLEATEVVIDRARDAGVLREDFSFDDVGNVFCAMSMVIANGGRPARDGLLRVILDGLRAH